MDLYDTIQLLIKLGGDLQVTRCAESRQDFCADYLVKVTLPNNVTAEEVIDQNSLGISADLIREVIEDAINKAGL